MRLPDDPDVAIEPRTAEAVTPVHARASSIALTFLGGTFGTAAREAISIALPPVNGVPYTIFAINVVGAFLLGVLLDALVRMGPDHGPRRGARLLLGTGFLGGFTTYSTFATGSALLITTGALGTAVAYALGTVLIGAAASWAGIAVAAGGHRVVRARSAR